MKRKLFGLILVASLAVTACAGTGSGGSASKDDSKAVSGTVWLYKNSAWEPYTGELPLGN